MKFRADQSGVRGLPMPLWLQGAAETAQAIIISAVLVMLPVIGVWLTGGFGAIPADGMARLSGQAWLLMHGVPLSLADPTGTQAVDTSAPQGTLAFVPLGLVLIPFLLSWRAGRRLARASYSDTLWQAMLGAAAVYAAFGFATGFVCRTADVGVNLGLAALVPLLPAGVGLVVGARREAGSWGRLIGVDAAAWVRRTGQYSRWAGSYLWSAARAGFVAVMAALALSAALLSIDLVLHWAEVVTVYEALRSGVAGGGALTVAQLGYLPNAVVWTLGWASGAGIILGQGSTAGALGTAVAPLPPIPILSALPAGELGFGFAALSLPVFAGVLAGWWFLREGENHFDEWLSIKVKARWFSAMVSTVGLGLLVGLIAGVLAAALAWLSGGSGGIGRLTTLGPDPLATLLWVGAEVGVGVVIGHAAGPWLERERSQEPAAR